MLSDSFFLCIFSPAVLPTRNQKRKVIMYSFSIVTNLSDLPVVKNAVGTESVEIFTKVYSAVFEGLVLSRTIQSRLLV